MKKLFIILGVVFASMLAVSATVAPRENLEHPQEYVVVECPTCGGTGKLINGYDAWGNPRIVQCARCKGMGKVHQKRKPSGPAFQGREPYYAECHATGCELFVPEKKGSTKCKCGASMYSHVKRYR